VNCEEFEELQIRPNANAPHLSDQPNQYACLGACSSHVPVVLGHHVASAEPKTDLGCFCKWPFNLLFVCCFVAVLRIRLPEHPREVLQVREAHSRQDSSSHRKALPPAGSSLAQCYKMNSLCGYLWPCLTTEQASKFKRIYLCEIFRLFRITKIFFIFGPDPLLFFFALRKWQGTFLSNLCICKLSRCLKLLGKGSFFKPPLCT
jgi:hypothetical protein